MIQFNQFLPNAPFLYTLKMSENLWFSGIFWGYRNGTLVENGFKYVDLTTFITIIALEWHNTVSVIFQF